MVGLGFVLYFPNASAHDGKKYIIVVIREIHAEIIFMISCLMYIYIFLLKSWQSYLIPFC